MPKWYQLSFTGLELKALWIRATGGVTEDDPVLHQAGENALDKVYRAERGMKLRAPVKAETSKRRGPDLDHVHHWACRCPDCRGVA